MRSLLDLKDLIFVRYKRNHLKLPVPVTILFFATFQAAGRSASEANNQIQIQITPKKRIGSEKLTNSGFFILQYALFISFVK